MSKVSFRARALDANRPLPIYYHEEIPDVTDFSIISRNVPQMPTGMEKEEEAECHLQEALQAFQQYKLNDTSGIPVPDIIKNDAKFKSIYNEGFKPSKNYVRIQAYTFSDDETPEYDVDDEDSEWLRQSNLGIDKQTFEHMLDKLERSSGHKVAELAEAKALLKQDDDLTIAVYDYWLNKRLQREHALIPTVKCEKRDGTSDRDPYVAFRRRTEKMQTRKNRKNDEQSYEKMLRLNRDMIKALDLLQMVCRREKLKQEQVRISRELYERRYEMHDFAGSHLSEAMSGLRRVTSTLPRLTELATSRGSASDHHLLQIRHQKSAARRQKRMARSRKRSISRNIGSPPYMFSSEGEEHSDVELGAGAATSRAAPPVEEAFPFRRLRGAMYAASRGPLPNYHRVNSSTAQGWDPGRADRHRFQLTCLTATAHSRRQRLTGYMRQRFGRGGRRVFDRLLASSSTEDFFDARDNCYLFEEEAEMDTTEMAPEDIGFRNFADLGPNLPVFRRKCTRQPSVDSLKEGLDPDVVNSKRTLGCFSGELSDSPKPAVVVKGDVAVSTNTAVTTNGGRVGANAHPLPVVQHATHLTPATSSSSSSSTLTPSVTLKISRERERSPQSGTAMRSASAQHPVVPVQLQNGMMTESSAARLPPASASTMVLQSSKSREQQQQQQHPPPPVVGVGSGRDSAVECGVSLGLSTEPSASIKQLNYPIPLTVSSAAHGLGVVGPGSRHAGLVQGQPRILRGSAATGTQPSANRRKKKSEEYVIDVNSDEEMDVG